MKTKTSTPPLGGASSSGDNIIDRATTGAAAAGIGNEPAFPNNNATNPSGQGASGEWAGPAQITPPSGDGVEQYFDPGTDSGQPDNNGAGLPEQAYAKPTDSPSPSALGPGMRA